MASGAIPEIKIPENPVENVAPGELSKKSDTDFAAIADDKFGETEEGTPPEPAPAQETGTTEPTVTKTEPPTEPVVTSTQPKQEAPVAAPPKVEPTTPAPPVVPQTPAVVSPPVEAPKPMSEEDMKKARAGLVEQISMSYKLSEDDKVALATDPEKVLPRLAANIVVDTLEATTRVIVQQIPGLIQQHFEVQNAARSARDNFFGKFPSLNKPEYIPVIQQVTDSYRRLNPQVPYEQAVEAIGKLSMTMLGLPLSEGTVSASTAAPSTPVKPATPLQPGSAARPLAQVAASNIFDELARFELVDE